MNRKEIYKGNAGNDEHIKYEEAKEIYQAAAKTETMSFDDLMRKEEALEMIEKTVPETVVRMWQQEVEQKKAANVTEKIYRRQQLIEDAIANGGARAY
jgi:hypothetical protein